MARRWRFEYPGTLYQVLKRGNYRINPQLYFADLLDKRVPADGKPSTERLEELLPKT